MLEIVQAVLVVLAGTFLYGLVGYLFRDQIRSRPSEAQAGSEIIDMAARHPLLEGKGQ